MGKARARKYYKSLARLKIGKEPERTGLPGSNEGTARVEPIIGTPIYGELLLPGSARIPVSRPLGTPVEPFKNVTISGVVETLEM
jgi:hypothetical protein